MTLVVLAGHDERAAALAQGLHLFLALAHLEFFNHLLVALPGLEAITSLAPMHVNRLRPEAIRHYRLALLLLTWSNRTTVDNLADARLHGREVDGGRSGHSVVILKV